MKRIIRAAVAANLLCIAVGATAIVTAGSAQADGQPQKLSREVQIPLADAQKALQGNDVQTALAKVKEAQTVANRTPFDDYTINSFLAAIYIQMKDYPDATTATEAAADSTAVSEADKKNLYHNAVLLATPQKQYQKAIEYGEKLAAVSGLDEATESMLAEAYYFSNDYANAGKYAQMSVDAAKAAGKIPSQNTLEIVMTSQEKQNNHAGAEQTLESIAVDYNASESWSQLIDLALSGKNVKDADALYLLRLKMLIPNAMEIDDYLSLASVANQQGYPTEALNALNKGIARSLITPGQAGQLLAQARRGADLDQRTLGEIAAQADRSKSGEQDIKLAEDYWGYGRFADAQAAAERAETKGGLKDPMEAPMLIGMLDAAQGKYQEALQTLGQVNGSLARQTTAHLWSLYVQAQLKQQEAAAPQQGTAPPPSQH